MLLESPHPVPQKKSRSYSSVLNSKGYLPMLQDLTNSQVEQALEYLAKELSYPLPEPLNRLNPVEWTLLEAMLASLLEEKKRNRLQ